MIRNDRADSGFYVVGRLAGYTFVSPRHWTKALSIRPSEVWIFGEPGTPQEHELWEYAQRWLAAIPPEMVHRFPKA